MPPDICSTMLPLFTELMKRYPLRSIRKVSELVREGGVAATFIVDTLIINVIASWRDRSVAVACVEEPERRAAIPYLYIYLEGKNDPEAFDEFLNSPKQEYWLLENFERVISFMCAPDLRPQREDFFEYQTRAYRLRCEEMVRAFREKQ
jgi:hypothetical protein